jgi:hypothetical protein
MTERKSINHMILDVQHQPIRDFKVKFPFIRQIDLANLFCVTRSRISEIIHEEDKPND